MTELTASALAGGPTDQGPVHEVAMIDRDLSRVRRIFDKLEQVRSRGLSCFGSDVHGFRLNEPLAEAELAAFEAKHGIRLPSDYRAFMTHAGNGGGGPYYGIYRLDQWEDFAGWVLDERPADFLARPCLLYPGMKRTPDWADRFGDASPYQGTLSLGTQGCTYAMQLIVTGAYAGRVVYVDANGQPPYVVRETNFLAWYERWLDELLQGYKDAWFGYGPGGGEDDFFRILEDPDADDELKAEAARAFVRLPRLSDAATARIVSLCDHSIAGVRAGACATIRTFTIAQGGEAAARLLNDPSPEVRCTAVRAVMTVDARRWTDAVLQRLRDDPDEDVASAAFFWLKNAGALSRSELIRIIEKSPLGKLRYFAAHNMKWTGADLDLLVRLLSDSHTQVRFSATLGLRQINGRSALPQVLELLSREEDKRVIDSILRMLGDLGDLSTVPTLLEWAQSRDDFHRLGALEALVRIGDDRAIPIAKAMLGEQRPPSRRDASGSMSRIENISQLVRKSLAESPSNALRALVR
jgi:HEAT repeat protein